MELVRLELAAPRGLVRPAVTVGNFDGVHRGHQALVAAVREEADRQGGPAAVLTFEPHPSRVLTPQRAPATLMTLGQKAEVLSGLGVDVLAVLPFTEELAGASPEEFARLALGQVLGARSVVVGTGFRFGRGRAGDLTLLRRLGDSLGFRVRSVEPVLHAGEPISSTRIREELARGAVEQAGHLLGRRFFIDGEVRPGAGRGRTLGLPTANLHVRNDTLPARGVYACWCRLPEGAGGQAWPAVANVGTRPTFGGGPTTVEAHLLEFDGDLYGRELRLEFAARLRDERTFPGPDALKEQIREDIAGARRLLQAGP